MQELSERIFKVRNEEGFNILALEVYAYQYEHCAVYREFSDALRRNPGNVRDLQDIPFLPIELFKTRKVVVKDLNPVKEFRSSGTTAALRSIHMVADMALYHESLLKGFELAYGHPSEFRFLALTPRPELNRHSSLIYMIEKLMEGSPDHGHGFFLDHPSRLDSTLRQTGTDSGRTMLIGLTYALLDFAEKHAGNYPGLIIVETGGMKGRRKEITRTELHDTLQSAFPASLIHSEYGMTELLSQAWSKSEGRFITPPWMKVLIREINDPFAYAREGRTGGISVIDLANLNSCSFIATQDLGRLLEGGGFEVLGRFDSSDLRGCSLMLQE